MFGFNLSVVPFLILPIVAAFIGVIVAERKGRSSMGWAILGLLLPVSVIVLLFLKPAGAVPGKWKECPACASIIKDKASVCPHCQRDVEKSTQTESAA